MNGIDRAGFQVTLDGAELNVMYDTSVGLMPQRVLSLKIARGVAVFALKRSTKVSVAPKPRAIGEVADALLLVSGETSVAIRKTTAENGLAYRSAKRSEYCMQIAQRNRHRSRNIVWCKIGVG